MTRINEYEQIIGQGLIDELRFLADRLKGKSVQHINSTAVGGGVAEILNKMVPLLKELGVETRWDVIKGGEQFFNITKKIHNALHGKDEDITSDMWDIFWTTGENNSKEISCSSDIVFVHDPQPISLINQKEAKHNKWIWRCHIDISHAMTNVWEALHGNVIRYDSAVFSAPAFSKPLPIRQFLISPSIDPLSEKNKELPKTTIDEVLKIYGINNEKPIITQVSRFDYLKDPIGVIEAFKKVKKYVDCQLVLAGGTASDDPESESVLQKVKERAEGDSDIHILLMPQNDIHVNAIQRASSVIVQKSIREGFGLTVTEALWKGKPVVASAVGGIPLQIKNKYHGLLCHSVDGAANAIKLLLLNPTYANSLGENGREHVRQNYLITRHLKEYLLLFLSMYYTEDVIHI